MTPFQRRIVQDVKRSEGMTSEALLIHVKMCFEQLKDMAGPDFGDLLQISEELHWKMYDRIQYRFSPYGPLSIAVFHKSDDNEWMVLRCLGVDDVESFFSAHAKLNPYKMYIEEFEVK